MTRMFFNSDKAFAFLKKNGYVYTLRAVNHKVRGDLRRVEICRGVHYMGFDANRVFIIQFSPEEMPDFLPSIVKHSGFKTSKEWLAEANRLSGHQEVWRLFYVHNVEDTSGPSLIFRKQGDVK